MGRIIPAPLGLHVLVQAVQALSAASVGVLQMHLYSLPQSAIGSAASVGDLQVHVTPLPRSAFCVAERGRARNRLNDVALIPTDKNLGPN